MLRNTLAAIALAALIPLAAIAGPLAADAAPMVIQPEALSWAPAPGLPPGGEVAVLYGDPSKEGARLPCG
jgi:hypothetical protein